MDTLNGDYLCSAKDCVGIVGSKHTGNLVYCLKCCYELGLDWIGLNGMKVMLSAWTLPSSFHFLLVTPRCETQGKRGSDGFVHNKLTSLVSQFWEFVR